MIVYYVGYWGEITPLNVRKAKKTYIVDAEGERLIYHKQVYHGQCYEKKEDALRIAIGRIEKLIEFHSKEVRKGKQNLYQVLGELVKLLPDGRTYNLSSQVILENHRIRMQYSNIRKEEKKGFQLNRKQTTTRRQ